MVSAQWDSYSLLHCKHCRSALPSDLQERFLISAAFGTGHPRVVNDGEKSCVSDLASDLGIGQKRVNHKSETADLLAEPRTTISYKCTLDEMPRKGSRSFLSDRMMNLQFQGDLGIHQLLPSEMRSFGRVSSSPCSLLVGENRARPGPARTQWNKVNNIKLSWFQPTVCRGCWRVFIFCIFFCFKSFIFEFSLSSPWVSGFIDPSNE